MIGKIPGIGYDNFSDLITSNNVYFDKTLLVKEILDSNNRVTLFTRPRRFGKTLNLSMIEHFFDITKKEQNAKLFENLAIMNTEYKDSLGSCPVINITFKEIKFDKFDDTYDDLKDLISKLYKKHEYVTKILRDSEKKEYENTIDKKLEISQLKRALSNLTEYLYRYHNKKVILLIDEYDTPIISAYTSRTKEEYEYIKSFMARLYSSALKGNNYLEFAVVSGILRLAKESIFSGLNNLYVNTILSKDFTTYFGFTHDEVKEALKVFGIENKFEDVCSWYDGYNFGGNQIFNPWSILNYLKQKELISYWVNTASNELLMYHFKRLSKDNFDKLTSLLKGECIEIFLSENVILENVHESKNIWSLLLYSGYLTVEKQTDKKAYLVRIVNYEIADTIGETFLTSISSLDTIDELNRMFDLLLNDKIKEFEEKLNKLTKMEETFNDFIDEQDYRLYFSTLLIILRDKFIKYQELEAGTGRADIIFYTRNLEKGYLIEFKRAKKEKDVEAKHLKGKSQIDDREYTLTFEKLGLKNISVYTAVGLNKNMYFKKWE